jgi:hypothetical protein
MSTALDYYLCYKEAFMLGASFGVLISYAFVCFFAKNALQSQK